LNGGTISGGTLDQQGGAALSVQSSSSNRLVGVQVLGDLNLTAANAALRVGGNLNVSGTVRMGALNCSLGFEGSQTFQSGTISCESPPGGSFGGMIEMQSPGTLTIAPGATIRGGRGTIGGSWQFGQPMTLVNNGTIASDVSGALLTIAGPSFTNAGQVQAINGGTLTRSGGPYVQTAGDTLVGNVLNASTGVQLNGGTLRGNAGTISGNVVNNGGVLAPGSTAAGALNIVGTYTQGASGVMNVEIGGTTQGAQFDRLTVSGAATLGGTLNIQLINGFQPTSGSFAILGHASRTGTFATVNGTSIGNGFSFAPDYITSSTQTTLVVQ
ncbi:MAG: hypothetical protein JNN27_22355, partial [Planctomycetes bacterium]|nr:hypothetical protein [Planctomycetota bacterium]